MRYVADAITFNTTAGNKTVAITPNTGDLLVAVAANTGTTTNPTVTDDRGGTYTLVTSATKNASADEVHIYVRDQLVQLGGVAHTLTMNVGGAGTGGGIWVARFEGAEKAGMSVVRGWGQEQLLAGGGTPQLSPANGRTPLPGDAIVWAVFNGSNAAAITPNAAFAERRDVGYASPTTGLEISTLDSGSPAVPINAASTSATAYCGVHVLLDGYGITSSGSGRRQTPGQPHETRRRRIPFPAYSQEPPAVVDIPTFGGAIAGGTAPLAVVATTAAGATGQGNPPVPGAVLTAQGALGQGAAPTSSVTSATGGALGQGAGPGAGVPPTPGGGSGEGATGPLAVVTLTSQGATSGGVAPGVPVYETPTFGGAVAGGVSPTAVVGVVPGGATSGGVSTGNVETDDFNRADEALTTPWVQVGAFDVEIVGNQLFGVEDSDAIAYYPGFADDHYSQVVVHESTDSGPAVRITPSGDAYFVDPEFQQVYKFIGGSYTAILTFGTTPVGGDTIKLEVEGDELRVYINGILVDSVNDSDLASGQPGVRAWNDSADGGWIDDWQGGDLAGGGIQAIVAVTPGGATAGGNAPTSTETPTPGSSIAGGFAPTSAASVATGGASADDLSPSAFVTLTSQGATAGGNPPTVDEGVTETPVFGGATAGGFSPVAVVGVDFAGSTGQGNQPGTAETAGSGGATAQGNTPTAVVGVTPGGATSGGNEPSAPLSETPTFGGATASGTAPGASVTSATGGASANGSGPSPSSTPTPGGATANGNDTSSSSEVSVGGSVAGGNASTPAASVDFGGSSTGSGSTSAIVGVDPGGAISGGNPPSAPLTEQPIFGGATAGGNDATSAAGVDQGGNSTGGGTTTAYVSVDPGGAIAAGRPPIEIGVTPPTPAGPTPGSGAAKRVKIHKDRIEYLDEPLTEEEEEALLLISLSLE